MPCPVVDWVAVPERLLPALRERREVDRPVADEPDVEVDGAAGVWVADPALDLGMLASPPAGDDGAGEGAVGVGTAFSGSVPGTTGVSGEPGVTGAVAVGGGATGVCGMVGDVEVGGTGGAVGVAVACAPATPQPLMAVMKSSEDNRGCLIGLYL